MDYEQCLFNVRGRYTLVDNWQNRLTNDMASTPTPTPGLSWLPLAGPACSLSRWKRQLPILSLGYMDIYACHSHICENDPLHPTGYCRPISTGAKRLSGRDLLN